VCVSVYAALKAAFLSTVFATLTEERNMIYLAPLMLIGTAIVFAAGRIAWWVVAAGSAFILFLIVEKPIELGYPYFESPGFGILTMANRHFSWDVTDLRWALVVSLAVAVALLAVRRARGVAVLAAVLVLAWMVTAEVTSTAGSDHQADAFVANLPAPLDWVDEATGRAPVTYLGQQIKDANGLWLTEFWNRGIDHVYSLDGTAPGPGPTLSPNILTPNGTLSNYTGDRYILADNGVDLQARIVARGKPTDLRLYEIPPGGTWQLRSAVQAVYSDGWMGPWAGWTFFHASGPGTVRVVLSRTAYNGNAPAGHATIRVGTVRIDNNQQAQLDVVTATRRARVVNDHQQTIEIPVRQTPVRVEVRITPTFQGATGDTRELGAQVGFTFVPATRHRTKSP
jgi:hypothetical protein